MTHTRRAVLDAAIDLVARQGHAVLSFREVARRAGVSHQAPYHHFGDREGILAAIAEEGFRGLAEALEATSGLPPAARLEASGLAYVRWALAHPGHYRTLFRPDLVEPDAHEGLRREATRAFAFLERLVAALHADGYATWRDPGVLLALIWSNVHGVVSLVLDGPLPPPGRDADRLAAAVVRTLTELITRDTRQSGSRDGAGSV